MDKVNPAGILLFIYVMAPVIGLSANAVGQIVSFRSMPKMGLLKSIYLGFSAGLVTVIAVDILYWKCFYALFQRMLFPGIANVFIYAVLGYCYFHFVGLGETARRIRMLGEIYGSRDGLSLKEILARYNADEIVKKRIARLLGNGQLVYKDGRYFIGRPVVLFIAGTVMVLKLLFLGRKREADRGTL
ncbi:MAG: hypothetical protein PHX20_04180 [Candidatus Omnitrophica bacterium]|nr:hypothetical protein [Candidatus Omnitrophota bacterium]